MSDFKFNEKYLSQIPALQQLISLGFEYITPEQALDQRGGQLVHVLLEDTLRVAKVFDNCWMSFEKHRVSKPTLRIARMKNRWGSLSRNATLTLNPELIKAPRECIEYVVIHELCHLLHHNHGPEFQSLLERSLPDWINRKHKLEMALFRQS